jgi:hypothetical protein
MRSDFRHLKVKNLPHFGLPKHESMLLHQYRKDGCVR